MWVEDLSLRVGERGCEECLPGEEEVEKEMPRSRWGLGAEIRGLVAVVEEDGWGSPKTKNLMKAPIRRTMDSWPRMKPWIKERL